MTRLTLLAPMLLLLAAAPAPAPGPVAPVPMAVQPGTPLDAIARQLVAQDLREAARRGEEPLVLSGTAKLGAPNDRPAVFVQIQSPRECGSAGCNTQVYVWKRDQYVRVLDGVSGEMAVAATRHKGMADLRAGSERYVWDGVKYGNVQPAPNVSLRPRQ